MKYMKLLKQLKKNLLIDEELRAYLYKDRIEIVDHMNEIELSEDYKLDEFFGDVCTLTLKDNEIIMISHCSHIITKANKDLFMYLSKLIGTKIDDLADYSKLPDIRDTDIYIKV